MISKKAVRAFLGRSLESYDWIKDAIDKDLEYEIAQILPPASFHTKPWLHQKACFLIGIWCDTFLFFLDLGTGKTKLLLDIIYHRIGWGEQKRALILVNNTTNIETWYKQALEHTPRLKVIRLLGGSHVRWKQLKIDGDAFVLNYQGLTALCCPLEKVRGKKSRERVVNNEQVMRLAEMFDILVLDESQSIKSHRSLAFKVCDRLAYHISVRYALTATPYGRDLTDLWAQFKVIDRGETLGTTLGIFRQAFFHESQNYWGGYEYKINRKRERQLFETLKNRSIAYDEGECHDLPKLICSNILIPMPSEYRLYYDAIVEGVKEARGDYTLMNNAFMATRQLVSGYVVYKGPDGERLRVRLDTNPKLDILATLVEDLPQGHKMVVFHEFTKSGEMIANMLLNMNVGHVRLWGGTKNAGVILDQFDHDPLITVMVVNSKTGGPGLNFQVANYQVFFESPTSSITRRQAEKRCHRGGQEKPVFIYDFMMKGTIEEKIKGYTQEGKDLLEALMKGRESWYADTRHIRTALITKKGRESWYANARPTRIKLKSKKRRSHA